jgi:hypothetical protein
MELTARREDVKTFASILKNQTHHKHDVIVPSTHLRMNDDGHFVIKDAPLPEGLLSTLREAGIASSEEERATLPYRALEVAHSGLVQRLPIPAFKRPYDYMRDDNPALLATVVNNYLDEINKNLLVRTFRPEDEASGERGILRAVLSDKYDVIDNYDVFMRALKSLREAGLTPEVNCSLTHRNMWVEFSMPELEIDASELVEGYSNPHVDPHDGRQIGQRGNSNVTPGFLLRNSEVGSGAFEIIPRLKILVCANGLIRRKDALRKVHLGSQMKSGVISFSDNVRRKAMEVTNAKVKEAVEYFITEEYVQDVIEDMMSKGADETLEHPKEAVTNAAATLGMTEDEEDELFDFFLRGGSQKKSAVPQAVTAMTQHLEDLDRAYELESDAWDLMGHMDKLDVEPAREN